MGHFTLYSMKTCECGRQFTEEQSSGVWCYRCKLDGLRVNWVGGGGYGREAFHSGTVKDHVESTLRGAERAGIEAEPVPQRAELI